MTGRTMPGPIEQKKASFLDSIRTTLSGSSSKFQQLSIDPGLIIVRRIVRMRPRQTLVLLPALAGLCLSPASAHQKVSPPKNDRESALHLLNRLTFGPRPGDIDRVLAIGIDKWIDQQLHPDSIDDHALDAARLSRFRTLSMSSRELAENFPPQVVIRQVAEGKQQLPRDPEKRAIYETQLEKYREKKDQAGTDSYRKVAAQPEATLSDE